MDHVATKKGEFEAVIKREAKTKRDFFKNSKVMWTKLPQRREQMIPLIYQDN